MTTTAQQTDEPGYHAEEVGIEVNYRTVRVLREVTGAEIKVAARLELTFELYRIHGEDEILIANDERITVHAGEKFVATPGLEPA